MWRRLFVWCEKSLKKQLKFYDFNLWNADVLIGAENINFYPDKLAMCNIVQKETIQIESIIELQKSNLLLYVIWFLLVATLGLLLLAAFVFSLVSEKIGAGIGGTLFLIIAKPPLTEILKYRDRIGILKMSRIELNSIKPDDPDFLFIKNRINDIIKNIS